MTTGFQHTFEHMVSIHGRSPTSSFLLCCQFSDSLSLPQEAYLDFPRAREWEAVTARYREVFAAYAIQPRGILIQLPNRRFYIGPHVR